VRELITDYLSWQVVVNGDDSILQALDIEEQYQISFWDALIIHAAHVSGAEILYSENLSKGQTYSSVRVVNPFAGDYSRTV
jgi:predicted nucleic acid-binding protein